MVDKQKNLTSISYNQLIADVIDRTAGHISEKNIKIKAHKTDLTLFGDYSELTQIWQNLIENAIKYMGKQTSPEIEIGVQLTSTPPVFTLEIMA